MNTTTDVYVPVGGSRNNETFGFFVFVITVVVVIYLLYRVSIILTDWADRRRHERLSEIVAADDDMSTREVSPADVDVDIESTMLDVPETPRKKKKKKLKFQT